MQKFNFTKFLRTLQSILICVLMVSFFTTCKEKVETQKSNEKVMSNVKIIDSANMEFPAELWSDNKTFRFILPVVYDYSKLEKAKIIFSLSEKATANPASGDVVNLKQPVKVTVTAEDISTLDYYIQMLESPSNETDFQSFTISVDGNDFLCKTDFATATVSCELPISLWNLRNEAIATFILPIGATSNLVSPVALDLTKEVKIVVTAQDGVTKTTWTVICNTTGFNHAEKGISKTFVELGYPGEYINFSGAIPSIEYGDLCMYHAYCDDYIVLLSRIYIDLKSGDFNDAAEEGYPQFPDYMDETFIASTKATNSIKVVNKNTLADAGVLNTGSISLANLKMITSDYKGRCVAAVVNDDETEFFYWTTPTTAPVSVGKIAVNMASTTDGSANFQVAGDITGNAWITALAPRNADGEHYRVKVTGGNLSGTHAIIKTGYASNDCNLFQMISPLDASDTPGFVVGDVEGTSGGAGTVKGYINNWAGGTTSTMPPFFQGNSGFPGWPEDGWVSQGQSLSRGGGRRPVVSALPINGKTYVAMANGSNWWPSAAVLDDDLQTWVNDDLTSCFSLNTGWSYGSWVDWYYDEVKKEAYLAVWHDRYGLITFKMAFIE